MGERLTVTVSPEAETVVASGVRVVVRDTGRGVGHADPGTGIGLANTDKRLRLLFGPSARLHIDRAPRAGPSALPFPRQRLFRQRWRPTRCPPPLATARSRQRPRWYEPNPPRRHRRRRAAARALLSDLLGSLPGVEIAGIASGGEEAVPVGTPHAGPGRALPRRADARPRRLWCARAVGRGRHAAPARRVHDGLRPPRRPRLRDRRRGLPPQARHRLALGARRAARPPEAASARQTTPARRLQRRSATASWSAQATGSWP